MAAMSDLLFVVVAANARDDAAQSGVFGNPSRRGGANWHDTPNSFVSQRH
jgi:hypothetical protein